MGIVLGSCHCSTKWDVVKYHIKQIFVDWKSLDAICVVADQIHTGPRTVGVIDNIDARMAHARIQENLAAGHILTDEAKETDAIL